MKTYTPRGPFMARLCVCEFYGFIVNLSLVFNRTMHITLPPIDSAFDSPLANSDSFVCQRQFYCRKKMALGVLYVCECVLLANSDGAPLKRRETP
jgi:hypothetical protein